MTIKFRRFIFWIIVGFFIVTSATVLFLAQGWTIDFKSFKFVKTGGIFIETSTSGAKIYVNDKYIESTSGILSHSRLVSGLVPRSYNIFVYKDGFYPWNKTIDVKSGIVTEVKNIILLPIELKKTKIIELPTQIISEFFIKDNLISINNKKNKINRVYNISGELISSGRYRATTTEAPIISPDGETEIYVKNNNIWIKYIKTADSEIIANYEPPIRFFDWFKDSEHIIWFADSELDIAERNNQGGKRNVVSFYLNINSPVFFDRDSSSLYFFEQSQNKEILYKINFE